MSFTNEFQHLKISLQDIKSATNDFDDENCVGRGGFGKVYKGNLLLSEGLTMVAVKRLDKALGQGDPEFWKEIMLLSQYKHENLVRLIGFCDEAKESVLVYEYLSNKSLDMHLSSSNLSWKQRLHVCIGAARGLQYLHDPNGTQQRVLHRDIKSSNILLDKDWNAKIADLGLSKIGPANQQFTFCVSNAVGTMGYCDPLYQQMGFLTKESDVYSFGVVLLEVLCGRHSVQKYDDIRKFLTALAQKCYKVKILDTIIHSKVKEEISPMCLERFSTIAHQCLNIDRTKRPSMSAIVNELEIALQLQMFEKEQKAKQHLVLESESDEFWETKLPRDWEELISKNFDIPYDIYSDKKKLVSHLRNGLPYCKNDKFFWINDHGKQCVLLSAKKFLVSERPRKPRWLPSSLLKQSTSRFSSVGEYFHQEFDVIKCKVNASLLSLGTMYEAKLVFRYRMVSNEALELFKLMKIRWKTGELSVYSMHYAELTQEGWYKIKMWHFFNHGPNVEFDIVIHQLSYVEERVTANILIQGIEFQPIEMIEHEDDDVYWENKLPQGYEEYIQMSSKPLHYTNKKELYFLFCDGFLTSNGSWFSLCKITGGMCMMLPARDIIYYGYGRTHTLPESRFGEAIKLRSDCYYKFKCSLESPIFSSKDNYTCYLVCKFSNTNYRFDGMTCKSAYHLDDEDDEVETFGRIHLDMSRREHSGLVNIPTIMPNNKNGMHTPDTVGEMENMRQGNDAWKRVLLCKSLVGLKEHRFLHIRLFNLDVKFHNIIVEGIEFRPTPSKF